MAINTIAEPYVEAKHSTEIYNSLMIRGKQKGIKRKELGSILEKVSLA